MAGGGGRGEACEVVRADTADLTSFVEAGGGYVSSLRALFDSVSTTRSRVLAAVGGTDTPSPRTGRLDGGWDPLAELIAESTLANLFAAGVRDALAVDDSLGAIGVVPAEVIDHWLADAGMGGLGADRSMAADQRLVEELAIRRELDAVLADLDEDLPDHIRSARVGLALEEWLGGLDGADPDRVAAAARVLIDRGVELRAGLDGDEVDGPEGAVAAMLVTQGVLIWPGDRSVLVDDLAGRSVTTAEGDRVSALAVLVDALDLDQSNEHLNLYGLGLGDWQRANQPWVRNAALIMLVDATIETDATISDSGQHLVDDVLDRYPAVVNLADQTWHDSWPDDRYQNTPDGTACRIWPTEGVRAVLGRALAAPNYGLTADQYHSAASLEALDADLVNASTDEFGDLWDERQVLIDQLAGGDPDIAALIDGGMAQGLTAAEALRLTHFASDPARTDDRVRRLRVVYPTTAWGDPIPPPDLDLGDQPDQGLPDNVARSLAVELGVLQTVQLARYAEGRVTPELPLTPEQIELVRRYDEISQWFHHRFAGSYPGGAEPAIDYLAEFDPNDLDRFLFDKPDGFEDLVAELARPENQIVWDLMAGAAGNDTFLGPDGTFRAPNGSYVGTNDAGALLVQLALLTTVGPYHSDLDLNGSGTIHEDEVADWLDAASQNGSIPPALIDKIRVGTSYGIGEDTFGWDEIGDIIGWVGLAAAITATIVYSGGTAAPLWVQAGLVGLAGLEAFAYLKADDPTSAALAGFAGLADIAAATRLIHLARTAPIHTTTDILDAERRYTDLIDLARRSDLPELATLADEAGQLTRTEFLTRYETILDENQGDLAQRLINDGATPSQASDTLRAAGLQPVDDVTVVAREIRAGAAAAEVETTADLRTIAADQGAVMEGLEFRLKTEESLMRKIQTDIAATPGLQPTEAATKIGDALRYTVTADPDDLVADYGAFQLRLQELGYEPVKVKNTWVEGAPYKGINTTWRTPDGQLFELQFHTPESFATKQSTHLQYEEMRLPETPAWRRAELAAEMVEISSGLTTPTNISAIRDYRATVEHP